jgi:FtsP/CotA-like multicopper oxidase with cupredoxin domain
MRVTRRDFMRLSAGATAGLFIGSELGWPAPAAAVPLAVGLSDPAMQPKFVNHVANALDPGFRFRGNNDKYRIDVGPGVQYTGLVGPNGAPVPTKVFGYGESGQYGWPARTIEAQSGRPIEVMWRNKLVDDAGGYLPHLLPVDTSLHWAYSLEGYEHYTIENAGIPVVTHLHGGHTDSPYDGNPEYFFSPGWRVRGPQWVDKKYIYHNDQPAGNLWFHDHALGITRLNVYAGMAGFYFIRDDVDTGKPDNALGLPAFPYEVAYAIQDRMFKADGDLFYPAFPGDPFYDDFITDEGADLPPDKFPGGGPTALAEFFGDHMVVNGLIWPKQDVEPRNYRMHLLNGTDSRFMVIRFRVAASPTATTLDGAGGPVPFWVIGSDQGLASAPTQTDLLVVEPGGRYDVVFDFTQVPVGSRVIMENLGGDAPFGGEYGAELDADDLFPDRQTDRIMAFDVSQPLDPAVPDNFVPSVISGPAPATDPVERTRKVALFEGLDEYGRLQPLLGTAEPEMDATGQLVNGAIAWHSPTTENPELDTSEIWEIYNATGDAHPVHLHLVAFEILDRQEFTADLIEQPVLQHNGEQGVGFRLEDIVLGDPVTLPEYVENAPKDMVTALPGQVTRIKVKFDKPGRYVWHCHILSHEDHEMMRVLHVGPGA